MKESLLMKKVASYSTREQVYDVLKEKIISLKFEPGQSISEKEISELFQVSRTPVREAFLKLTQENLLEVYPQRGTFVSLIDLRQVEEARFIRESLERSTIRVACKKITAEAIEKLEEIFEEQKKCIENNDYEQLFELDEKFHHLITGIAQKELVWDVIQKMNAHLNRIRMLSLVANLNWDLILDQHERMIEALRTKNADSAEQVMEEHLKKLTFELEEIKTNFEKYFK